MISLTWKRSQQFNQVIKLYYFRILLVITTATLQVCRLILKFILVSTNPFAVVITSTVTLKTTLKAINLSKNRNTAKFSFESS